jgi:hypothetical protein
MERKAYFLVATLVIFLVAAMGFSYYAWTSVGATSTDGMTMNGNGVAALIIGGIGSLVLGGGLMALVFYSARRGYDDAADLKTRPHADP